MSDDGMSRSARALRETFGGASDLAASTRARVVSRAAARRRRNVRRTALLLPLAAILMLSTAWAAVTGRLARVLSFPQHVAAPAACSSSIHASPRPPAAAPTAAASAIASTTPGPADASARPSSSGGPPPLHSASSAPAQAPGGASATAEEDLYAAAHRAHFVRHDPGAALRRWDAYLAAYPQGRFALEARYNRALTLVRVGRGEEARLALAPFADGREGGYRQREARELLNAIDALDGGLPLLPVEP
jgi:TolA-binding protein